MWLDQGCQLRVASYWQSLSWHMPHCSRMPGSVVGVEVVFLDAFSFQAQHSIKQ